MMKHGGPVTAITYYTRDRYQPRGLKTETAHEIYWASIAAEAATWLHVTEVPGSFVVCTTGGAPSSVADVVEGSAARVLDLEFAHRPPGDLHHRYNSTWFLLDAMAAIAAEAADDDLLLFVDPDIVWAKDPVPLIEEIRKGGVMGYELRVPADLLVVERCRAELGAMGRELLPGRVPTEGDPVYFGGEIYGMTGATLREILPLAEELWLGNLERFAAGKTHMHLEEHLMCILMWAIGETEGRANPWFQRIKTIPRPWGTRKRYRPELVGWHLPNEKEKGFQRLREHVGRSPLPALGPAYETWLRTTMGITPRGPRRARELLRPLTWRLRGMRPTERTQYGL